jgi:hypothetical protein
MSEFMRPGEVEVLGKQLKFDISVDPETTRVLLETNDELKYAIGSDGTVHLSYNMNHEMIRAKYNIYKSKPYLIGTVRMDGSAIIVHIRAGEQENQDFLEIYDEDEVRQQITSFLTDYIKFTDN